MACKGLSRSNPVAQGVQAVIERPTGSKYESFLTPLAKRRIFRTSGKADLIIWAAEDS